MKSKQLIPKISPEKKKWAENRDVYLNGYPLAYNVGLQEKYNRTLQKMLKLMTRVTKEKLIALFRSDSGKQYFKDQKALAAAMDASLSSQARILLNALIKQFTTIFDTHALDIAAQMVQQQDDYSGRSLANSIKQLTGGFELQADFIPASLKEVIKASISENVYLIQSIPEKYFTDITGSVMRSITGGGGVKQLIKDLNKYTNQSKRRVKNLALDQTRKAYNSINRQRMMSAGYTKFKWLHSGGGQQPRKDHIKMHGNVYSFDDPPIIDKNTGERGFPGQAINCGCTMQPVYEFPKGYDFDE